MEGDSFGEISSLTGKMCIDKEIKIINLAQEWLFNHPTLSSWINGAYLNSHSPTTCYVRNFIITECQGIEMGTNVDDGWEFIDSSIELCQNPKIWNAADGLHKLGLKLESKKDLFSQLNYFTRQENDIDLLIDCFMFYSSACISDIYNKSKHEWTKMVLIIVHENTPDWVIGTSVASALLAGCSVIINPSLNVSLPYIPFLLAETSKEAGLPGGLISVVSGSIDTTKEFLSRNFYKVVLYGDLPKSISLRSVAPQTNFSYITLGHTAFIILNNCDLDGPARKLFSALKNWNSEKCWRPDLVVIEESILDDFVIRLFEICFPDMKVEDIACLRKEIFEDDDKGKGLVAGINVDKLISAIDKMEMNVECKNMSGIHLEILIKQDKVPLNPNPESGIVKVLVCRTGKEAVELLNNFGYCLGTSIWTGNISEATEIAMELESSSVWINCHGITDPRVAFEPSRLSGSGSFGGFEGILNFGDVYMDVFGDELENFKNDEFAPDQKIALKTMALTAIEEAVKAFRNWMKTSTDRAKYLRKVKNDVMSNKWSEYTTPFHYSFFPEKCGLYAMQLKKPVGVILIVIDDWEQPEKHFSCLVSPAIAVGNAVIVVASEHNARALLEIVKLNLGHLPKGVLNVLKGFDAAIDAGKNPNIKAIWFSTPYRNSSDQVRKVQEALVKEGKNFWCTDDSVNSLVFYKQCLRKQTIWLPTIHRII